VKKHIKAQGQRLPVPYQISWCTYQKPLENYFHNRSRVIVYQNKKSEMIGCRDMVQKPNTRRGG